MTLEAHRTRLLLLVGALVLVGVGLWVFVAQGANRPADPELGASVGERHAAMVPQTPMGARP
jgi:hypothetical protein